MHESLVKWISILLVIAGGVSVNGQQVLCRSDIQCNSDSVDSASPFECCVTLQNGLGYTIPALEPCFVCIVYGFNTTEFVAVESDDNYTVEFRVIKGLSEFAFPPVYRVQMKAGVGNVDSGDVLFEPKEITLDTDDPILITFKFILDGVEREQNETFTLEIDHLRGPEPQDAFVTREINMVIIDGDIPSISLTFEENRTEVFESETDNTSICIITVNQEVVDRVINLTVIFSKTDDTSQATKNLKLDPFQSKTCFILSEVDIFKDDDIYEQDQNFILSLSTTFEKDFSVDSPANIILKDDDAITVGWEEENYDFKEDEENTPLCIIVTSGSFIDIPPFGIELTEGTAKNGTDFLINSTSFKQTDGAYCINIFMIDDEEFESLTPENFTMKLVFDADLVTILPDTTYISITDNEVLEITITGATTNESDPFEVCANKNMTTVDEFVVSISSSSGTAESGKDFAPERIPSTIILQPEETIKCFVSDAIIDDEIALEPMEFFTLTIDDVTPNDVTRINLGPPAMIVINDNDDVTIMLENDTYEVDEGVGEVEICAILVTDIATSVSFNVVIPPALGRAEEGLDFNGIPEPSLLNFVPNGPRRLCTKVVIIDDGIIESIDPENLFVEISRDNISLLARILITDNEVITVGFEVPSITVAENSNNLSVCLVKNRTTFPISVHIISVDGTAIKGTDYQYLEMPMPITIEPLETSVCFTNIIIINDEIAIENDTFFFLSINKTEPDIPKITLGIDQVRVVITDDDNVIEVSFTTPNITVHENESAEVCFKPSTSRDQAYTIMLTQMPTGQYPASPVFDYIPSENLTVTIPDGPPREMCVSLEIIDDTKPRENPETIIFMFRELPSGVVRGENSTAVVTIIDDDPIGSDANDTVTGDPVMKVPIRVPQEQLASISANRLSLCYEVHGAANEWFNLISDQCASVNAHYSPVNENLNVVDKIGIRAVDDDGKCVNIMLNSENCSFDIDGISAPYNSKGIKVRKYLNHIRISVPNCDELRLTMWSICIHREYNGGMDHADLLELVVVRGLNYGHRKAHGLIGQYWNIPVSIEPFNGTGIFRENTIALKVNVMTTPKPRSYVGIYGEKTWQSKKEGSCVYVGDSQASSLYEVDEPNDGVIEGDFRDYIVRSAFVEDDFKYGVFNKDKCIQ